MTVVLLLFPPLSLSRSFCTERETFAYPRHSLTRVGSVPQYNAEGTPHRQHARKCAELHARNRLLLRRPQHGGEARLVRIVQQHRPLRQAVLVALHNRSRHRHRQRRAALVPRRRTHRERRLGRSALVASFPRPVLRVRRRRRRRHLRLRRRKRVACVAPAALGRRWLLAGDVGSRRHLQQSVDDAAKTRNTAEVAHKLGHARRHRGMPGKAGLLRRRLQTLLWRRQVGALEAACGNLRVDSAGLKRDAVWWVLLYCCCCCCVFAYVL